MKRLLLIIVFILSCAIATAQETTDTLKVYFRRGYSIYEPQFRENGVRMQQFIEKIKAHRNDSTANIIRVKYLATASPEGYYDNNLRLAQKRAAKISEALHSHLNFADSIVSLDVPGEDYRGLEELVEKSSMPYRDEVLDILRNTPVRVLRNGVWVNECKRRLIALHNGEAWRYMYQHFFDELRRVFVYVVVTIEQVEPEPIIEPIPVVEQPAEVVEPQPQPEPEPEPIVELTPEPEWRRQIYAKTNAIGWGLMVANAAGEIDVAPHWSVMLPVYYSGVNYFTSTVKFRTFAIQPEVRYWLFNCKERNDGLFVGAHLGMAYYNYAVNGEYRIQDHNGNSPALGGGVSVGYRMPLTKKNSRWKVEFSLGAGVYALHYDKWYNEYNGQRATTVRRTWFGIDHAAVSFAYMFDWNKKNRKN